MTTGRINQVDPVWNACEPLSNVYNVEGEGTHAIKHEPDDPGVAFQKFAKESIRSPRAPVKALGQWCQGPVSLSVQIRLFSQATPLVGHHADQNAPPQRVSRRRTVQNLRAVGAAHRIS